MRGVAGAPQRPGRPAARRRRRRRRDRVPRRGRGGPGRGVGGPGRPALALDAGPLLPEDLYEPWSDEPREAAAGTAPGPAAADRPVGGGPGGGRRRRAGPPGDRPRPRGPGRPPGGAAAAGAAGPGPSQGAGHRPQRGRAGAAQRRADGRCPRPVAPRPVRGGRTRLVGRRDAGDQVRARLDRADEGRGSTPDRDGAARGRASPPSWRWPPPWPGGADGGPGAGRPPRSRGRGRTRRSWRPSATSAASTPPSWTGSATPSATRWSGPCRAGTSPGAARRLTSGCSWRPPSCCGWRPPVTALLLVVDDIHEADQGSLRLLHYLARCAVGSGCSSLLAHRPDTDAGTREVARQPRGPRCRRRARAAAAGPLGHAPARCTAVPLAGRADAPADLRRQWRPAVHRAGDGPRRRDGRPPTVDSALPPPVQRTFQRVALLGTTFTTDELLAVAGVPEEVAYRHLDTAPRRAGGGARGRRIPVPARPGP